jgi:hypothetical protein
MPVIDLFAEQWSSLAAPRACEQYAASGDAARETRRLSGRGPRGKLVG